MKKDLLKLKASEVLAMPPFCDCHQEPMTRRNDTPRGWRCAVAHRAANLAYFHSRKGYDTYSRRYLKLLDERTERDQKLLAELEAQLAAIFVSIDAPASLFEKYDLPVPATNQEVLTDA